MRCPKSWQTRGGAAALSLCTLCALSTTGCASSRQAAGVGLIVVGTVAAAAGMAATNIINETPDPSQPVSARSCLDRCTHGSDSAVDALLVAGGAATVLAGEALVNTAPTKAPGASSTPSSPVTPAPLPKYAPAPAPAPAPAQAAGGSAAQNPTPAPGGAAQSATRCLGPLRDPALAGCAPSP